MVKNSPSISEGCGFDPWSGRQDPTCLKAKKNKKQKQYCNRVNKDFKNGQHQKNLKKKKVGSGLPLMSERSSGVAETRRTQVNIVQGATGMKVEESGRLPGRGGIGQTLKLGGISCFSSFPNCQVPNPCCWVLLFLKTSQDSQVESPDF